MSRWFADGSVVLLILVFMLVELIALILVRKKMARSVSTLELSVSLGAGAALMLALRAALTEAVWQSIACWLIVSLACHLWDLKLRWATRRTR